MSRLDPRHVRQAQRFALLPPETYDHQEVPQMTPDEQDQHRATDDGMPTAETRRRIRRGTRVRSTRHGTEGTVVGHDPDMDLPLVTWIPALGGHPEAVKDDEYEVIT